MKVKPTKYEYLTNDSPRHKTFGVSPEYQFNWFVGGADTLQGGSGGPLWRNIKVKLHLFVGWNKRSWSAGWWWGTSHITWSEVTWHGHVQLACHICKCFESLRLDPGDNWQRDGRRSSLLSSWSQRQDRIRLRRPLASWRNGWWKWAQ